MTFVLTVIVGMIVVPVALYFANQGPRAISIATITTVSSARTASPAQTATPANLSSPSPSPS